MKKNKNGYNLIGLLVNVLVSFVITTMTIMYFNPKMQENKISILNWKTGTTSYDIKKPNTWPANTEIDFGNSLYGTRFTGTITATKGTYKEIVLKNNIAFSTFTIIGSGGTVGSSTWGATLGFAGSDAYMWIYVKNDNTLRFGSRDLVYDRTNARYDIWVTYTK